MKQFENTKALFIMRSNEDETKKNEKKVNINK